MSYNQLIESADHWSGTHTHAGRQTVGRWFVRDKHGVIFIRALRTFFTHTIPTHYLGNIRMLKCRISVNLSISVVFL